jgi:predicted amidohydrolase
MKTAIIQHAIQWGQTAANLQVLSELMEQQRGVDLLVLSETFATGFMTEGALTSGPSVLDWMQREARRLDAAIAGSVAFSDDEGLARNRLFFVRPDGTYDYYDKHHLFSMAGETETYVAGQQRVVVTWRGVRLLLQVCYDLRFPVFSRNHGDYDAILYVANWPKSRREVWQTLLKARALENQCYVIGVNCVGCSSGVDYAGDSVVLDAYGRTVASCPVSEQATAIAELDMAKLDLFRQKFPVLNDAD